jgi:hypothetical protein
VCKIDAQRMYNITVLCTLISGFDGLYAVSKKLILTELHRIKGTDPQLTANWNVSNCCAACSHGTRFECRMAFAALKYPILIPCHLPSLYDLHILVGGQAVF